MFLYNIPFLTESLAKAILLESRTFFFRPQIDSGVEFVSTIPNEALQVSFDFLYSSKRHAFRSCFEGEMHVILMNGGRRVRNLITSVSYSFVGV